MSDLNRLVGKDLQRIEPDIGKARKSLEISAKYLEKANSIFRMHIYDVALLVGYNSLFHASRALLFKDGYKDRSHWSIIEYLRIKYKNADKTYYCGNFIPLEPIEKYEYSGDYDKQAYGWKI